MIVKLQSTCYKLIYVIKENSDWFSLCRANVSAYEVWTRKKFFSVEPRETSARVATFAEFFSLFTVGPRRNRVINKEKNEEQV